MEADHPPILMDGPSGPPCGGRSALGLVPQLEAGPLGRLRLDHNLGGGRCAGRLGGSGCDG